MDFNFITETLFRTNSKNNYINVVTPSEISSLNKKDLMNASEVIDKIGALSSKAQELRAVITTASKFIASPDQKLYVKAVGNKVMGFLKTGIRKLFIRDKLAQIHEITPLCVLDFYVHESQQRSGIGKALFDEMLSHESTDACLIGYDRPSSKLISFLSKHYGLKDYTPQNNNYVVYDRYFSFTKKGNSNKSSQPKESYKEINSYINKNEYSNVNLNSSKQNNLNNQKYSNLNNDIDLITKTFKSLSISNKKEENSNSNYNYNSNNSSNLNNRFSSQLNNAANLIVSKVPNCYDLSYKQINYNPSNKILSTPWATENDIKAQPNSQKKLFSGNKSNYQSSNSSYGVHYKN